MLSDTRRHRLKGIDRASKRNPIPTERTYTHLQHICPPAQINTVCIVSVCFPELHIGGGRTSKRREEKRGGQRAENKTWSWAGQLLQLLRQVCSRHNLSEGHKRYNSPTWQVFHLLLFISLSASLPLSPSTLHPTSVYLTVSLHLLLLSPGATLEFQLFSGYMCVYFCVCNSR